MAVQAVLESGLTEDASRYLRLVREFDARGALQLGRRERRDLEELERAGQQHVRRMVRVVDTPRRRAAVGRCECGRARPWWSMDADR